VAFHQGSAEATGFADAEFDAVVSRQLLWSLTDPVQAVREWARVTKPAGRVIAIDGLWHDPRLSARLCVQAGTALARLRSVRYPRYDDPYWDHVD
ncbi:MAG: class I SAM-dependent methyltransferase, partial [Egibacteraceae bacterium]